jgi:hypothetical protein
VLHSKRSVQNNYPTKLVNILLICKHWKRTDYKIYCSHRFSGMHRGYKNKKELKQEVSAFKLRIQKQKYENEEKKNALVNGKCQMYTK